MLNKNVNELIEAINELAELKVTAKFNYALSKALQDLEKEGKLIAETVNKITDFTDEERDIYIKLLKGVIKDEEVEPKLHKTILEKHNKSNEFLCSKFEGDIYKIKLEYIPDDIPVKVFNLLMLIIEE